MGSVAVEEMIERPLLDAMVGPTKFSGHHEHAQPSAVRRNFSV